MATNVILPALGMSQDTGKIVHWLKAEGEQVTQGEPLVEIETDKATVEIEAPASGLLARVAASDGDDVPVGQVIAVVLAQGEAAQEAIARPAQLASLPVSRSIGQDTIQQPRQSVEATLPGVGLNGSAARSSAVATSLLASRIAAEHHVDLGQVKAAGQRVQKADVLAYLQQQPPVVGRLFPASPKARRLARERGQELTTLVGTGPGGAVLSADVQTAQAALSIPAQLATPTSTVSPAEASNLAVSTVWRIMAERTTQSWNEVPHFYLAREVACKPDDRLA